MKKDNNTCVVCGNKYTYCNSCGTSDPAYMQSFCSENCMKVYDACAQYNMGQLSKEVARDVLKTCDLTNKKHFSPATRKIVQELIGQDEMSKDNQKNFKKGKKHYK